MDQVLCQASGAQEGKTSHALAMVLGWVLMALLSFTQTLGDSVPVTYPADFSKTATDGLEACRSPRSLPPPQPPEQSHESSVSLPSLQELPSPVLALFSCLSTLAWTEPSLLHTHTLTPR